MKYDVIIGCEVHVQLLTNTKAFCGCEVKFGGTPNTRLCPVCLGLPGALPVPNKKMIEYAIKAGLALNCSIAEVTKFDRKNYIYPDLPKGYQISQFDMPLCEHGHLDVETDDGGTRRIGILRAHQEEDAGKLIHPDDGSGQSLVDLNRCGTPLLEIVSDPDLRSSQEAVNYVRKIREIIKFLGVSDCNMEEGSLRCDANINLWIYEGEEKFATPIVEIKNMNSFKAMKNAMDFEVERQLEDWQTRRKTIKDEGKTTRGYDDATGTTILQRHKEEASEYRYFPEPDMKPLKISRRWVEELRAGLPELPEQVRRRFQEAGLSESDIHYLTSSYENVTYFNRACEGYGGEIKKIANWICSDIAGILNEKGEEITSFEEKVSPPNLKSLVELVDKKVISGKIAKSILVEMVKTGETPEKIVEKKGMKQISDPGEIGTLADNVMEANPKSVEDYKNGNENALKFLMGQIMKLSKGKANPALATQILKEKLGQ